MFPPDSSSWHPVEWGGATTPPDRQVRKQFFVTRKLLAGAGKEHTSQFTRKQSNKHASASAWELGRDGAVPSSCARPRPSKPSNTPQDITPIRKGRTKHRERGRPLKASRPPSSRAHHIFTHGRKEAFLCPLLFMREAIALPRYGCRCCCEPGSAAAAAAAPRP